MPLVHLDPGTAVVLAVLMHVVVAVLTGLVVIWLEVWHRGAAMRPGPPLGPGFCEECGGDWTAFGDEMACWACQDKRIGADAMPRPDQGLRGRRRLHAGRAVGPVARLRTILTAL